MASTKRALLTSVLAIVACVAMLIGSTFAWFTDTAGTAVNKIQAGKLNIELLAEDGVTSLEGATLEWQKAEGAEDEELLWEPGCRYQLQPIIIKNAGDLALKYKIVISGIKGDAKLNDAIDWTIGGVSLDEEKPLLPGRSDTLTIEGRMKKEAGNEYQGLSIDGISITVFATQYTHEYDSIDNTYDEDATYAAGAHIAGLKGTYDTLTAAAKAWRESKGVVTEGTLFGANRLGTVDTIAWIVSGEVATGDGAGVIGSNGAGNSILGGGYFTPGVTINNVMIKGVNGAKIVKTGDSYLVSTPGKNVVYENITFTDTVRIDSNPGHLTFRNCTFAAGLRMPHTAADAGITIENCTFTGNESSGYAVFAQGSMASFKLVDSSISDCQRGINIQAGDKAAVTVSGNTIKNISGKPQNDGSAYGAAIQLTSAKTFAIENNKISDVAVNALHIWASDDGTQKCAADSIVIKDNTISAAYLCWNQAEYDMSKVVSSGNRVTVGHENKCITKTAEIDSTFTLN